MWWPCCAGALGLTKDLKEFLPVPLVEYDGQKYSFNYNLKNSIGKTRCFHGPFSVILKAYAWIKSMGPKDYCR